MSLAYTGWWFGCLEHSLFFHILGIIIPIDWLIFFRRNRYTTNQHKFSDWNSSVLFFCRWRCNPIPFLRGYILLSIFLLIKSACLSVNSQFLLFNSAFQSKKSTFPLVRPGDIHLFYQFFADWNPLQNAGHFVWAVTTTNIAGSNACAVLPLAARGRPGWFRDGCGFPDLYYPVVILINVGIAMS